jgi:hypothetical protein
MEDASVAPFAPGPRVRRQSARQRTVRSTSDGARGIGGREVHEPSPEESQERNEI